MASTEAIRGHLNTAQVNYGNFSRKWSLSRVVQVTTFNVVGLFEITITHSLCKYSLAIAVLHFFSPSVTTPRVKGSVKVGRA